VFTKKHHSGDNGYACWLPSLSFEEEFSVFDRADGILSEESDDNLQVSDSAGNLYGYHVLSGDLQHLQELGTWHQQIAEFPLQRPDAVWHGYPIWPIYGSDVPCEFAGQRCRPSVDVFKRMLRLGHIDESQLKRLKKGDWI
jgi:hypothetical protein